MELGDVSVTAVPSAHDALDVTPDGLYPYLGFILRLGEITVYHSGDTMLYDGLPQVLQRQGVDVALLPINGRDARRKALGTSGNLNAQEAADLAATISAEVLIPHHYDMFAFNTGDPEELVRYVARRALPVAVKVLKCGEGWVYARRRQAASAG